MKTSTQLATTLFALASLPLLAQQQPQTSQQPDSPSMQQSPSSTQMTRRSQAATPEATASVQMTSVNGELIDKLDSKTAKTGDSVVVQTKTAAKTPDGTVIPKGSKLIGHVIGVQPSAGGQTSQVALLLDQVELNSGQSMPVHSQIQSIAPAGGTTDSSVGSRSMSTPQAGGAPSQSAGGSAAGANSASQATAPTQQVAPAESSGPPAGTVVAKSGAIDIRTTSVPGVLLANNAPGQQDPRMTQTSSILLGAKQDVQLNPGTQMVIAVAATGGGTQ